MLRSLDSVSCLETKIRFIIELKKSNIFGLDGPKPVSMIRLLASSFSQSYTIRKNLQSRGGVLATPRKSK